VNAKKIYKVALCRPQLAENVGAAARAASVMGFNQLLVIAPQCDIHSSPAYQLASHASDLLDNAMIEKDLDRLLAAEHFIVGFSARPREMNVNHCSLPELSERLSQINNRSVVLLFGSERTGLTNQELSYCHLQCFIPTFNESYSSLNLAQAVQIVTYSLGLAQDKHSFPDQIDEALSEQKSSVGLTQAFYQYIDDIAHTEIMNDFCQRTTLERTLLRLRIIFNKIITQEDDVKFLFGFFKALTKRS